MLTAQMTAHARERCEEMGVSTKVAKRIVAEAEVRYPGSDATQGTPTHICMWSGEPQYVAVVCGDPPPRGGYADRPLVMTLLFNTREYYERAGTTYIPVR